jgi:hypothetical protein
VHSQSTASVTVAELRELVAIAARRHPEQRAKIEKAATILLLRSVRPDRLYADTYDVESETQPGTFYSVNWAVKVCQCPYFQHRGGSCKHIWALKLLRAVNRLQRPVAAAVAA